MKRLIYVFLAALTVSGCNLLDLQARLGSGDGSSKYPHERSNRGSGGGDDSPGHGGDTIVWVSAVEYPEDYDWNMDSLYGNVEARIILYRNFKQVLSIPSGGNPAQDRHHIMGGELYTEAVTETDCGLHTCFSKNGEVFLEVPGLCTLAGIMKSDGHVHALVRPMSCEGFTLYIDDVAIISRISGHLCGDPSNPAYSAGGALYDDDGKCTFCYWTTDDYYGRVWHCVRNCTETLFDDTYRDVVALRMIGDKAVCARSFQGGRVWDECHIWDADSPVIGGLVEESGVKSCAFYLPSSSSLSVLCMEEGSVYVSDVSRVSVCQSTVGKVSVFRSGGEKSSLSGVWRYVYPSCAALAGDRLLLALNPENMKEPSIVHWGDSLFNINVHGFVSNVSYTIE